MNIAYGASIPKRGQIESSRLHHARFELLPLLPVDTDERVVRVGAKGSLVAAVLLFDVFCPCLRGGSLVEGEISREKALAETSVADNFPDVCCGGMSASWALPR